MANTQKSEEIKAQMYKEALDTVEVINILDEDIVIHNDKKRPTHTKWIIPNKNKDLGLGKGKQHVPAFIAWRYMELALTKIITEMSHLDWDSKKDKYRDEERSKYEQNLAIRTNDKKLRAEIAPKLWGGIVQRYGGDDILEPEIERKVANPRQDMKKYLSDLGLSEKLVDQKDQLAKDIS